MEDRTEKVNILRLTEDEYKETEDTVVREFPLTIVLNDQELVTMLCSPANQRELAVGFLYSEGLIEKPAETLALTVEVMLPSVLDPVDDPASQAQPM